MARFFFDIIEGQKVSSDNAGIELPSAQKAHEEAVRTAAEMTMDNASTTGCHEVAVAVFNQDRHHICTAKINFDPGKLNADN